jgi:hypothetical protein
VHRPSAAALPHLVARRLRAAFTLALVLVVRDGFAGPPFRTDDPEPVELHHVELYLSSEGADAPDGGGGSLPLLEFNYGVLPNTQFHIVVPYAYADPAGHHPTARGFGDIELGIKFRFLSEGRVRPQVGVFPLVELPTGDASRGLGAGATQIYLPLWVQKSWGKWTSYGGAGWWRNPGVGQANWGYAGWLLQRKVAERLTVGGEMFAATASQRGGSGSSGYNLGVVVDVSDAHHVLLSAGKNLSGDSETHFYVGYQLTLGS